MRQNDIRAQIPGLAQALEREHLNRGMAFVGVPWTLVGCDVLHLAPRHRLELQMTGNAFMGGAVQPLAGDIFQFLWRLHPKFARKVRSLPVLWAYAALKRRVRRCNQAKAKAAIVAYLGAMLQDLPEDNGKAEAQRRVDAANYVHWMATEAHFYLTIYRGMTIDAYMDTPYLALQQLFRAYRLANEEDPTFINASDRIASDYIKSIRLYRADKKSN